MVWNWPLGGAPAEGRVSATMRGLVGAPAGAQELSCGKNACSSLIVVFDTWRSDIGLRISKTQTVGRTRASP